MNNETKKELDITNVEQLQARTPSVIVVGNGNTFQLLCKASCKEQGWMKSTKAMEIAGVGCVVQVTTQQGDNVAEAVTFVPNVCIMEDVNGGRKLVQV